MKAGEAKKVAETIVNAQGEIEWHTAVEHATELAHWVIDAVKVLEKICEPMPGSRDNELVLYQERLAREFLNHGYTGL